MYLTVSGFGLFVLVLHPDDVWADDEDKNDTRRRRVECAVRAQSHRPRRIHLCHDGADDERKDDECAATVQSIMNLKHFPSLPPSLSVALTYSVFCPDMFLLQSAENGACLVLARHVVCCSLHSAECEREREREREIEAESINLSVRTQCRTSFHLPCCDLSIAFRVQTASSGHLRDRCAIPICLWHSLHVSEPMRVIETGQETLFGFPRPCIGRLSSHVLGKACDDLSSLCDW